MPVIGNSKATTAYINSIFIRHFVPFIISYTDTNFQWKIVTCLLRLRTHDIGIHKSSLVLLQTSVRFRCIYKYKFVRFYVVRYIDVSDYGLQIVVLFNFEFSYFARV